MSTEHNRGLVRRYFDEIVNEGHLHVIDEIFSAECVLYFPPGSEPLRGRDAIKKAVATFRQALPDVHETIEAMVVEDDSVAVRLTVGGTHKGPLLDVPATGKRIAFGAMHFFRLHGGLIVEDWIEANYLGLLRQLGGVAAT
jgi:steroid delta-isomerase-like uncharacterized protein